jgi:hypothetical protein
VAAVIPGGIDTTATDKNAPSRITGYAIIDVGLRVEPAVSSGFYETRAMIDTGATESAIHADLAAELALTHVGWSWAAGFQDAEPQPVEVYLVRMAMGTDMGTPRTEVVLPVTLSANANTLFQVIIGNDLLQQCQFTYNRPVGRFVLALP